jgi:hypothetical protein
LNVHGSVYVFEELKDCYPDNFKEKIKRNLEGRREEITLNDIDELFESWEN